MIEVGLLLNFGARSQVKRLIFTNDRKAFPTRAEMVGSPRSGPPETALRNLPSVILSEAKEPARRSGSFGRLRSLRLTAAGIATYS